MKKVSVIITTYGGGKEITRSVDSVLGQTYDNYELIVVDDNGRGTENQLKTENILKSYIDDKKLNYIVHEVNKNGSAARNTGFRESSGEYIMFLDDDDEYTPYRIEKQVRILEKLDSEWGLCYCSHEEIQTNGTVFARRYAYKSGDLLYSVLMHYLSVMTCNTMIRREAYENIEGFDETFIRHQDWEFFVRLAEKYKIVAMRDIGLIKHLEFRNSPKSVDLVKEYREKYLKKVSVQLDKLSPFLRKRVIAENKYDIAMQYLKTEGFSGFIREYRDISMGYFGIEFLVRRSYYIIRQRIQKLLINKSLHKTRR